MIYEQLSLPFEKSKAGVKENVGGFGSRWSRGVWWFCIHCGATSPQMSGVLGGMIHGWEVNDAKRT